MAPSTISLLLLLCVITDATNTTPRAAASSPSPAAAPITAPSPSPSVVFLRERCATTLYPAACYDSLLPYAAAFQTSHARLARVAVNVAVARLQTFSARLAELRRGGGSSAEPREAAALRDCGGTISAASGLARQSSAELGRLDAAAGSPEAGDRRQARWRVANAQTWLSAAITNEGTCVDGFEAAGSAAAASAVGKEVAAGVANVRQYTSNALALVNGIPL